MAERSGIDRPYDIALIGGGIVGLSAALITARAGADVVLIDRGPAPRERVLSDGRTAALLDPAIDFLKELGIWPALADQTGALEALRIVNLANRQVPDADVTFRAAEVGLGAFGYNVPNDSLSRVLFDQCAARDNVTLINGMSFTGLEIADDHVSIGLDDGRRIMAKLLVAADGRQSAVRQRLGIDARIQHYHQSAIVCTFDHARPHDATSIELHRPGGPFTMVPLPGRRSSLVWVEPDDRCDALMALDDDPFRDELGAHAKPWLGAIGDVSARRRYALSAILTKSLTGPRTILLGEAAHALSPIGAQGLNLSLQDVSLLGELITQGVAAAGDLGSPSLLSAYRRKRMPDIRARFLAVDGLNRMVASDWRAVALVRATGLQLLGRLPFARRQLMRAMMKPLELPDFVARMAA